MSFKQLGSHSVNVEAKYKFVTIHFVTKGAIGHRLPTCLILTSHACTGSLGDWQRPQNLNRLAMRDPLILYSEGKVFIQHGFVSISGSYPRFYCVSDYLKCFVPHRRSKRRDFELGPLLVIRWCCGRVFCKVPVICSNTVIVEMDFKILEIF